MTKTRGIIYATTVVALLAYLYVQRRHKDKVQDAKTFSTVLPTQDEAKLIVLPKTHTIEVVQRNKDGQTTITKRYLPDTGASVDIRKDGGVAINSRTWGTEVAPFVGCALGSDVRIRGAVGLNLFYVQRWELGTGLLANTNIHDTRLFLQVSYNFYDRYYVAAGFDNHKTAQLMAGFKF